MIQFLPFDCTDRPATLICNGGNSCVVMYNHKYFYFDIFKRLPWKIERILWIGYYKNLNLVQSYAYANLANIKINEKNKNNSKQNKYTNTNNKNKNNNKIVGCLLFLLPKDVIKQIIQLIQWSIFDNQFDIDLYQYNKVELEQQEKERIKQMKIEKEKIEKLDQKHEKYGHNHWDTDEMKYQDFVVRKESDSDDGCTDIS